VSAIRVANAPVSFGAFEETVGSGEVPTPEAVLIAIAGAGYEGTELGPPGYLGTADELAARLDRHALALTGGFVPVRFSDAQARDEDLAVLAEILDLFEAVGATDATPVLADAGSERRRANPGRGADDRSLGLHDAAFRRLVEGVERALDLARSRGFDPVFHHHAGTFVEALWEIERLLDATDVGLLLDTGHILVGGGEPLDALVRWGDRVGYVHVKDVRLDVLHGVVTEGADMMTAWRRGLFCELGEGDVDLPAFFDALRERGYDGWLVVEQDRILEPGEGIGPAAKAQGSNRRWLAEHVDI